jgi:hypothetical protein
MLDVERVLLSVRPRKADGTPDSAVRYTWASSAPEQIGVEPLPEHEGQDAEGLPITIPDTHECWATTPLDRGAATVSAAAPRYTTDTIDISYEPGVPGQSNLSAGTPVPD